MKTCEWCGKVYDDAIIQTHHINHIHEDDRPENKVDICMPCHMRHHKECGYNTIIIKKSDYKPKTLEDEFEEIVHKHMLAQYESDYAKNYARERLEKMFGEPYVNVMGASQPFKRSEVAKGFCSRNTF